MLHGLFETTRPGRTWGVGAWGSTLTAVVVTVEVEVGIDELRGVQCVLHSYLECARVL